MAVAVKEGERRHLLLRLEAVSSEMQGKACRPAGVEQRETRWSVEEEGERLEKVEGGGGSTEVVGRVDAGTWEGACLVVEGSVAVAGAEDRASVAWSVALGVGAQSPACAWASRLHLVVAAAAEVGLEAGQAGREKEEDRLGAWGWGLRGAGEASCLEVEASSLDSGAALPEP